MTFIITFALLFCGWFLLLFVVRLNTLKLHSAYYRKANVLGCADRYESLVRLYNSTDPRVLEMAYLEAVSFTKAA